MVKQARLGAPTRHLNHCAVSGMCERTGRELALAASPRACRVVNCACVGRPGHVCVSGERCIQLSFAMRGMRARSLAASIACREARVPCRKLHLRTRRASSVRALHGAASRAGGGGASRRLQLSELSAEGAPLRSDRAGAPRRRGLRRRLARRARRGPRRAAQGGGRRARLGTHRGPRACLRGRVGRARRRVEAERRERPAAD